MKTLQILTYNIHKGLSASGLLFKLHQLKEVLQQTQVDVVMLQEVVGDHKIQPLLRNGWPKESQFEFLADNIWSHYSYGKNAVSGIGNHGNAILSRYPIIKSENINISTNKLESRGLLHAVIQPEDAEHPIHLLNVHLNLLHGGRVLQAQKITERVKSHIEHHESLVLAGDFNDWGQKMTQELNQQLELNEAHKMVHGCYGKSFPSFWPVLSLDRVYIRKLEVLKAQVMSGRPWNQLSDHLPLLVTLKYN
jgi:endonuclease/exonuclease/phosphatase family metal-dependent hydrolase